ncbi:MAG: ABC transporter permease [Thermodesulfobacteriota bacterium]
MEPSPIGPDQVHRPPRMGLGEIAYYFFCGLVFLFLIAPLFVVIPISFSAARFLEFPPRGLSLQWYHNYFTSTEWITGTLNSLQVAAMTSVLSTLLGIPAALALTRHRFKGGNLLHSFLISPMITPVIIVAIAVYFFFARVHLVGSVYSLALAHTVLAVPVVVVTVSAALQGFDLTLERAALSLGANRLQTFLKVTFPLIRPGVISGMLFAFITSFDEVVIAIFVATYRSLTLPKHMWAAMKQEIDPTIAAVSTILVVGSISVILTVALLQRRAARLRGQSGPGS